VSASDDDWRVPATDACEEWRTTDDDWPVMMLGGGITSCFVMLYCIYNTFTDL